MINKSSSILLNFEIKTVDNDWIFGTFFALIDGVRVGNEADVSVDMKGCLNWWLDLTNNPRNRYEPGLYEENKERAYLLLASSVLVGEDTEDLVPELYENTYSRFHVSHIGMSSFDNVTMIFMKNEMGFERLIWKTGDGPIHEAHFDANEVERVFLQASVALDKSIKERIKEAH